MQVDTLSTTHERDSILRAIRNSLDQAERERKFGLNYLMEEQEELLLKANEVVYANLMLLLNDLDIHIEKEVSETRLTAVHVVNHTVSLNKLVLMAVISIAFILAVLVV